MSTQLKPILVVGDKSDQDYLAILLTNIGQEYQGSRLSPVSDAVSAVREIDTRPYCGVIFPTLRVVCGEEGEYLVDYSFPSGVVDDLSRGTYAPAMRVLKHAKEKGLPVLVISGAGQALLDHAEDLGAEVFSKPTIHHLGEISDCIERMTA
jgi:hypothetical protein